jgi:1,4-dihydroxy-6-naphthoate synthase
LKLTLGFSPCPNDTFIFDALVNKKIDTESFEFEVLLEDVQTLNTWAMQGKLDVSKISYGVLPLVLDEYIVLDSGSALGKGVGPLLVSKKMYDVRGSMYNTGENSLEKIQNLKFKIQNLIFAIPGENTTAHMLFSMAFPQAKNKRFVVFNEVEDLVLSGEVDAGVIIHENRFTYQDRGLINLMDLGAHWEDKTSLPIPLGGIVIKRTFDTQIQKQVQHLIKKSVEYAFLHYPHLSPYVIEHSQEMSEDVMRKHIDLYVNDFSLSLKKEGREAIIYLLNVFNTPNQNNVFVF